MSALEVIGVTLVAVSAIPANGIVWLYTSVPWTRTRIGRALVTKSVALALLIDFAFIRLIAPDSWAAWLDWTRLLIYPMLTVGLYLQFRVFHDTLALARIAEHIETGSSPPPKRRARRG